MGALHHHANGHAITGNNEELVHRSPCISLHGKRSRHWCFHHECDCITHTGTYAHTRPPPDFTWTGQWAGAEETTKGPDKVALVRPIAFVVRYLLGLRSRAATGIASCRFGPRAIPSWMDAF